MANDDTIDQITDRACDLIAREVQTVTGQKHGDVAGLFFSDARSLIRAVVSDYLAIEELYQ